MPGRLLRLALSEDVTVVAVVDDFSAVIVIKHLEEITNVLMMRQMLFNTGMGSVCLVCIVEVIFAIIWEEAGETVKLAVDNPEIISQPSIRYLGVTFDSAVSFLSHDDISDKTADTALAWILPIGGAPIQSMKLLPASVVSCILCSN